jgi:beta-galactosidase/beta-glucuronidase
MGTIDLSLTDDGIDCPDCDRCGVGMRLFGIEAHPTVDGTDVHTYVCAWCDAVQTRDRPAPASMASATTGPAMPPAFPLATTAFDSEMTSLLASAFDAAWQSVQASNSTLADAAHATSTRALLAKSIIEMGQRGERNHQRLVENASARLADSTRFPEQWGDGYRDREKARNGGG